MSAKLEWHGPNVPNNHNVGTPLLGADSSQTGFVVRSALRDFPAEIHIGSEEEISL